MVLKSLRSFGRGSAHRAVTKLEIVMDLRPVLVLSFVSFLPHF
jgi:hypothetical protein